MPAGNVIGRTGAIAVNGLNMDFNSFQVTSSVDTENATPYQPFNMSGGQGTGPTYLARMVSSGTPTNEYQIGAFMLAGATGTAPGLDGSTMNGSIGSVSLQYATGCTSTCNTVLQSLRATGARTRATVAVAIRAQSAGGSATETWNVTTSPQS